MRAALGWQHLKHAHRAEPRFAVIAYGKLGGKELGYGGDLDVVFLYDTDPARDGEDADLVPARSMPPSCAS